MRISNFPPFLPSLASASAIANVSATPPPSSTTLQPLFGYPVDGTTTAYATTKTKTFTVDCRGASLRTETFTAVIGADVAPTAKTTLSLTTSPTFTCTTSPRPVYTTIKPPSGPNPAPTPSPLPKSFTPLPPLPELLLTRLRTATLYAALIGNGGFLDEVCAALNPAGLGNNTGYDAEIVQKQVCRGADLQAVLPDLAPSVVVENQMIGPYLAAAVTAVQFVLDVVGVMDGITTPEARAKACALVEEDVLNGIFSGYVAGGGTDIKKFVCEG